MLHGMLIARSASMNCAPTIRLTDNGGHQDADLRQRHRHQPDRFAADELARRHRGRHHLDGAILLLVRNGFQQVTARTQHDDAEEQADKERHEDD